MHEHEVLRDAAVVGFVQPERPGKRDGVPRDPAPQAQIRKRRRLPIDGRERFRELLTQARLVLTPAALLRRAFPLCHISPSLRTRRGEAPASYVLATFLTRGQGVCHVVRFSGLLLATLIRLLAVVRPKAELPLGANCFLGPKRCFRPVI